MKKLLLLFFLCFSAEAFAINWVEVFVSNSTGSSFYVDVDRIEVKKKYTYFWVLANFAKPVGASKYLSAKIKWKADCKEKKRRKLSLSIYKKNNAEVLLETFRGFGWEYPTPRTIGFVQLKFACDRVNASIKNKKPKKTTYLIESTEYFFASKKN